METVDKVHFSLQTVLTTHSLNFHSYDTRNKNTIKPPRVKRNWGKQRSNYQAIKEWNNLAIEWNDPTLATLKRNLSSKFLTLHV